MAFSLKENADKDIKKIKIVLIIVIFFMCLELWGHLHSHSLSLLADSVHLLVDVLGFVISIIALKLTKKERNKNMTFGYHRLEVIGALLSIVFIWIPTIYLIIEAYSRFLNPIVIKKLPFLIISIIGFFVNLICLYVLHDHSKERHKNIFIDDKKNLNIRTTYLHIVGDLIQSIGMIIASILTMIFPKIVIFDIMCTISFAIIVIISTLFLSADAIRILLEAKPKNIDYNKVCQQILSLEKVKKVRDLKLWSISVNNHACIVIIECELVNLYEYEIILNNCKNILREKFKINHIFIEIETENVKELSLF